MNKQMTPAEIELLQQGFARLAPISDTLVGVKSGPWPPPPNIPAAIAPCVCRNPHPFYLADRIA
jgi:hypothetical protein